MRGRWVAASGLLLLAGCRSRETRGPALTRETTFAPQGQVAWRSDVQRGRLQGGTFAEQAATPRIWAMTEALVEAELAGARLAETRAPSREVQDYAAKSVEERTAELGALRGVAREEGLDVDLPAVQGDPVLEAEREAARSELEQLRPLDRRAFEAAYLGAQPASLARLAALAEQGERAATDVDVGNVLRMIAQQAREQEARAEAILPEGCGGRGAGPRP